MEIDNDVSDLQTLITKLSDVNNCTDSDFSKGCMQIAEGLSKNHFTIVNLTEKLGSLLVDISSEKRALGTSILSQVLEATPRDTLLNDELKFICTFYADRLKDNHQVIPAVLRGILALAELSSFLPNGSAIELLSAIFQHIPCQQQPHTDRYNIYSICRKLLKHKASELKQWGLPFVLGVISAMDGERDPRNLMFLFDWLPEFFKTIDLVHLTEDMFEVIACYFPIDFRAPPTDPDAISRERLAESLCVCLCAVPSFGQFCLPLALEKLDSSLTVAKLDSLQLLKQGCKVFTISEYAKHSIEIWSLIYKELLNSTDLNVIQLCFDTLSAFIQKLSQGDREFFRDFLRNITDTTKGNLLPDGKLFEATSKILLQIAKASQLSADFVIREIAPILTNTHNITKTPTLRAKLLRILVSFRKVYAELFPGKNNTDIRELDEVCTLCVCSLNSDNLELQIVGLQSIASIIDSLPYEQRMHVYCYLRIKLLQPHEKSLRDTLLLCFNALAVRYTEEIQVCLLRDMAPKDLQSLYLYLNTLGTIAYLQELTDLVLPILTSYCLKSVEESEIAFSCLREVLLPEKRERFITSYLIERLNFIEDVKLWIIANLQQISVVNNQKLLENIAFVLMSLMGDLNEVEQNRIVQSEVERILDEFKKTSSFTFIILLNGLFVRIRNDYSLIDSVVEDLLKISLKLSESKFVHDTSVQFLANILNKSSSDEKLQSYLNKINSSCNEALSNDIENINNTISMISWVTKALAMRAHVEANTWIEKMLALLEKHREMAVGFKILMSEDCEMLNTESYCKIQILYRQKLFQYITNKLNESSNSVNHLTAFGFLVQQTPYQIFQLQMAKILRLLLLHLDVCTEPEVLHSVLQKLLRWLQSKDKFVEDTVSQFLPRFLKLSHYKPSMKVRIIALECIRACTLTCPTHVLLPYKKDVVLELAECLDDHKRMVRKNAAEARSSWILIDAPL